MTIAAASDSPTQEDAMRSAFDWIRSFGEYICSNGTQCFDPTARSLFGLVNTEAEGTYSGTRIFSDGTALTLGLGRTSDGTLYPYAACAMIVKDTEQIVRFDWDERARKNRDRWVHAHLYGNRHHHYMDDWSCVWKAVEDAIRGKLKIQDEINN